MPHKTDKAGGNVEGRLELIQGTMEHFQKTVGDSQVITNRRIEEMGARFTHLTTITEELSSTMGALMKKLEVEKSKGYMTAESVANEGKGLNPTTPLVLHINTPREGEGSAHTVHSTHDVARSLQFQPKEPFIPPPNWILNPYVYQNPNPPPPGVSTVMYNPLMGYIPLPETTTRPFVNTQQTSNTNPTLVNPQTTLRPPTTPVNHTIPPLTTLHTPISQPPLIPLPHTQPQTSPYTLPNLGFQGPYGAQFGPFKVPKMDFPRFEGKDPRGWVNKCEKFFLLNPYMDSKTKVIYATLHLEGEADIWYQTIQTEQPGLNWESFIEFLYQRFSKGGYENIVGQFNKLIQRGRVEEYIGQFDELRKYIVNMNHSHSESYYVDSFLSGLKEEISSALYLNKPVTLKEARD